MAWNIPKMAKNDILAKCQLCMPKIHLSSNFLWKWSSATDTWGVELASHWIAAQEGVHWKILSKNNEIVFWEIWLVGLLWTLILKHVDFTHNGKIQKIDFIVFTGNSSGSVERSRELRYACIYNWFICSWIPFWPPNLLSPSGCSRTWSEISLKSSKIHQKWHIG